MLALTKWCLHIKTARDTCDQENIGFRPNLFLRWHFCVEQKYWLTKHRYLSWIFHNNVTIVEPLFVRLSGEWWWWWWMPLKTKNNGMQFTVRKQCEIRHARGWNFQKSLSEYWFTIFAWRDFCLPLFLALIHVNIKCEYANRNSIGLNISFAILLVQCLFGDIFLAILFSNTSDRQLVVTVVIRCDEMSAKRSCS